MPVKPAKKPGLPRDVERRIRDRPYYAYLYAANVLRSRLPERLELALKDDPHSALLYAQNVVGGRLPDPVHNALVMYSLEKRDAGGHVSEYLKWLEEA
jgi:hypothetical protein